ncbi:MAG: hypothetical protein SH868_09500 [Bythopirellula sp.]|nr:hypothetical protein [Bythopirellula sp.]
MLHLLSFRICCCLSLLLALVQPSPAITFRLVQQIDTTALSTGAPGSIAAYGNDLYYGSLFAGATLYHISDPLGAATLVNTFGGINNPVTNGGLASAGLTTNGYVSLHTDGTTLVAATNNGGATADIAQSYDVGTDVLNWGNNGANLFMQDSFGRIDGAAVDPSSGHIMLTCFGCDDQNFINVSTGANEIVPAENILFYPGVGTGWRDIDYDLATGDIYLRANSGVARGEEFAPGRFTTLEGDAGVQTIVDGLENPFRSAINVAFLPSSFAGQELVIVNDRDATVSSFASKVKFYSATPPSMDGVATDTPVAVDFVATDGVTPFSTSDASSGIYDFSFDPVNQKLYVSDFSSAQIYIFGIPGAGVTGDFDGDGDVDGRDFLVWQRGGSPAPFSPADLSDWQGAYGAPLSAFAAVPEPHSAMLLGLVLAVSVLIHPRSKL